MRRPEGAFPTFDLQQLETPPVPLPPADEIDKALFEFAKKGNLPQHAVIVDKPDRTVEAIPVENTIQLERHHKN